MPDNPPIYTQTVSTPQQVDIANTIKKNGGLLLTEWVASDEKLNEMNWYTLYLLPEKGLYCFQSLLNTKRPLLKDLSFIFPVCNRLQRAIYDLMRISTHHAKDKRPWLNHGHFPSGILHNPSKRKTSDKTHYAFKKVSGNGVHEIPVGPVHAGIIEPGHFRFSVVGERILKLEERLGYTHKGIHQLLRHKTIDEASRLIGRVSGDTTVAYLYAFSIACEHALDYKTNRKITFERMILLERERLANHIGDIGAIINDAAVPSLQASFLCLKEKIIRNNMTYAHHRYLMDCIKPFSEKSLLSTEHFKAIKNEMHEIEIALQPLQKIVDGHYGLQDRLKSTGIITCTQAKQLGLLGLAAKASGIDYDLRLLFPESPQQVQCISPCAFNSGDVEARTSVRFKECFESMKLIRELCQTLLHEEHPTKNIPSLSVTTNQMAIGIVEAWRGPVIVVVSTDGNKINWCHFHDPSWQNWLALEYAVMDNIVADFPLINKSFNLSYSGQDA